MITTEDVKEVHACRLDFYADRTLDLSTELLAVVAHNGEGHVVDRLKDMRLFGAHLMIQVSWAGLPTDEDTWEHLDSLRQSVPRKLTAFLRRFPDATLVTQARAALQRRRGRRQG